MGWLEVSQVAQREKGSPYRAKSRGKDGREKNMVRGRVYVEYEATRRQRRTTLNLSCKTWRNIGKYWAWSLYDQIYILETPLSWSCGGKTTGRIRKWADGARGRGTVRCLFQQFKSEIEKMELRKCESGWRWGIYEILLGDKFFCVIIH